MKPSNQTQNEITNNTNSGKSENETSIPKKPILMESKKNEGSKNEGLKNEGLFEKAFKNNLESFSQDKLRNLEENLHYFIEEINSTLEGIVNEVNKMKEKTFFMVGSRTQNIYKKAKPDKINFKKINLRKKNYSFDEKSEELKKKEIEKMDKLISLITELKEEIKNTKIKEVSKVNLNNMLQKIITSNISIQKNKKKDKRKLSYKPFTQNDVLPRNQEQYEYFEINEKPVSKFKKEDSIPLKFEKVPLVRQDCIDISSKNYFEKERKSDVKIELKKNLTNMKKINNNEKDMQSLPSKVSSSEKKEDMIEEEIIGGWVEATKEFNLEDCIEEKERFFI